MCSVLHTIGKKEIWRLSQWRYPSRGATPTADLPYNSAALNGG